MGDSEDEIFWGPVSERERMVKKINLLKDISERFTEKFNEFSEQPVDNSALREDNLKTPKNEVFDPSNHPKNFCGEEKAKESEGNNELQCCSNSIGSVEGEGNSEKRNIESLTDMNTLHDVTTNVSFSPEAETSNDDRSSVSFISQSLGSEISAESYSVSISSLKQDTCCEDSSSISKSNSQDVFSVSLCSQKLASLTTGETIDAATDSVLLQCSFDSNDCSSESDCLNDTMEEVESMMKRAQEILHHTESPKECSRDNELKGLGQSTFFNPNVKGAQCNLKPGCSHETDLCGEHCPPNYYVGINTTPTKVTERSASVKCTRIPRKDGVKRSKLTQKKHHLLNIESPIAGYINHRPLSLLKNVKIKNNIKRDFQVPLRTLPVFSDENRMHLTPAKNEHCLPIVQYETAPVVNINHPRFIEKNVLLKPNVTPKVIKHAGRAVLTRSPHASPSLVHNEVSIVYEKNVSATNNLK